MREPTTLKELEPGDIFRHAKGAGKYKQKFLVYGNPVYNSGHGSSTRICIKLGTNEQVSKSCRLSVVKLSESIRKAEIMAKFKPKAKQ